jgi:5-methyltetrahydropteroyltriglutamate--homocysteine methyltransferase
MATRRTNPPFRAEHIGSLKRPDDLQKARERLLGAHDATHHLGPHDNPELRKIEDRMIQDAVKLQEDVGMPVVTDGEFRRRTYWTEQMLSFSGIEINYQGEYPVTWTDEKGHAMKVPMTKITSKVRRQGSPNVRPFQYLQGITQSTIKVTLPTPAQAHYFGGRAGVDKAVYPDESAFFADLAAAFRAEVDALAQAGCRYIQVDECMLAFMLDERHRAYLRSRGDDPDKLTETYCKLLNDSFGKRPADMVLGVHLCRGNNSAHWLASGGYDNIADRLFNTVDADVYFLEYDTERAGDFGPLRLLPEGKTAMLGLISTKTPKMESADDLKRRIDAAAKHTPLERLGITPQCGFASNYIGNPVTIEDQKRKLALCVGVARDVWGTA